MSGAIELAHVQAMDRADGLADFRDHFHMQEGLVYLDGNSLGALPKSVANKLQATVAQEWGGGLIRSWNAAGWIEAPRRIGDKIAQLIGARPGEVVAADSTSVNLHKLLVSALLMKPGRSTILTDKGNFPSDIYIAEGVVRVLPESRLVVVDPEDVASALNEDVAVLVLSEVDYRTGRRYDMASLTDKAHSAGALVLWDLCHSAGAFPVDVGSCHVDLAVGCGYKFLNGGPGAPSFLYVPQRLQGLLPPILSGWMGHRNPFDFDLSYEPSGGIERTLAGTPGILGLTALEAALDVMLQADMTLIRQKSIALGDLLIALVEQELPDGLFTIPTPRDASFRGSHVSLQHPEAYAIVQALIELDVIGDFRTPDIARFGLTPLYTRFEDVWIAVQRLKSVMTDELWRQPKFAVRTRVT